MKKHVTTDQDNVWQQPVIDKDLNFPPTSPFKGDRYLILNGGVGSDWESHDNEITYYDGTTWQFIIPKKGTLVLVKDESNFYKFNGSTWVLFRTLPDIRFLSVVGG